MDAASSVDERGGRGQRWVVSGCAVRPGALIIGGEGKGQSRSKREAAGLSSGRLDGHEVVEPGLVEAV